MTCSDFEKNIKGYRLTTTEILYYLPDYPQILQSFLWQTYDKAPKFPRIYSFLDFWRTDIEAIIHSVRIASKTLITPVVWNFHKSLKSKQPPLETEQEKSHITPSSSSLKRI